MKNAFLLVLCGILISLQSTSATATSATTASEKQSAELSNYVAEEELYYDSYIPKITIHQENLLTESDMELLGLIEYDPPEGVHDLFTDEEYDLLCRIVEAECTDQSVEAKINVCNAILNRLESDEFPDTVEEVVYQKCGGAYQFSPVKDGRLWSVSISDSTIEAWDTVFNQYDTINGATYFLNKKSASKSGLRWFEKNLEYVCTDDANHSFYKIK